MPCSLGIGMRARHLAIVGLAVVALAAPARAHAQDVDASSVQTAPNVEAPPASSPAVRLHLRSLRAREIARLYVLRNGAFAFVCASPCTADVAPGSEMQVTLTGDNGEAHAFVLPGDLGPEIDIVVKPASIAPVVGGIVMMGSGGGLALLGLLFVALGSVVEAAPNADTEKAQDLQTAGYVVIGVGAAVALGGLVWLTQRSREPRVTGFPHRQGSSATYGRHDTLLGDLAVFERRPAANPTALPAAFMPLQLRFTF